MTKMMTRAGGVLGLLIASGALLPAVAAAQGPLELVSVNRRGTTGDGASASPAVSGNGRYVAFASDAINLRALNDRLPYRDVFVRDRLAGTTEKISIALDGGEANNHSQFDALSSPSISFDGCVVAYSSLASNLVEGDENGFEDVFVRNRCDGTTTLISRAEDGGGANGDSTYARLSASGQFVVFQSTAGNLVGGDNNGRSDIFLHDRVSGSTIRVSVVDGTGDEADGDSVIPAISADGTVVAFESVAGNLAEGANGNRQVFVHEVGSGRTELVSRNANGFPGTDQSFCPALNEDGSVVAFKSDASNLVAGDTNGVADTFVRDRSAGTTERVSLDNFGNQARSLSAHPILSADGRFVAFPSFDDFFDPNDSNTKSDIFLVDRQGGEGNRIVRVSVEPNRLADGGVPETAPAMSANGRWIAFSTTASNYLEPGIDLNNALDVFVTCNPLLEPCPPQCLGDENCDDGLVCDPNTNTCVEPSPTPTSTATDTATSTPTRPTATFTPTRDDGTDTPTTTPTRTPECDGDEDCDPGSRCVDGQCVPLPCDDDADCPPASMCEDGQCVPIPCDENRDCPPGSLCDPEDDICRPIPCDDDSDCPDTAMCGPDGVCVPIPCDDDADCPPGSICTEDDICVPLPCDENDDCPEPSMCEDGQCVPIPCDDDADCPDGNECDELEGYCVPGDDGGGGGGCSCEIDPRRNRTTPLETLAFLLPALLLWVRRRAA